MHLLPTAHDLSVYVRWWHWAVAIPLGFVLVFLIPMFLGINLG